MNHKKLLLPILAALAANLALAAEEGDADAWDVSDPPGDSRTVSIDTTSGTWMSLDVSPDGRTVAFDLLGDIYVLPIEGGEARAIDSGVAWSMQPRFSPDGTRIAYTSDAGGGDNIWIMNADGSGKRQLTHENFRLPTNPWWSPDGTYIAARKHFTTERSLGTGEIWLWHVNGGDGIAVVERPNENFQKELGEPAFSPDGRYLYYTFNSTPGNVFQYAQDSNDEIFQIRRYDLEKGESEAFVTGPGGAVRPTPSPDGKYLAFVRRKQGASAPGSLFLKDLASGREWSIYDELDPDLQEVWTVHGVYPNMDSEYHHATNAATARLLAGRGVPVSIGAHGQREGLAAHWEIWGFVQGGMTPIEALRAATIVPARALGFADDLGSLVPGKLADLVVIDANVLENPFDSDRVSLVMLNGRLYDARTLDETVTGSRRTEPFYWQR